MVEKGEKMNWKNKSRQNKHKHHLFHSLAFLNETLMLNFDLNSFNSINGLHRH